MSGRVGRPAGSSIVAYVGLGVLSLVILLGAQRLGLPDLITARTKSAFCGVIGGSMCRDAPGRAPNAGAQPGGGLPTDLPSGLPTGVPNQPGQPDLPTALPGQPGIPTGIPGQPNVGVPPGVGAQPQQRQPQPPPGNGWSGVGQRSAAITHVPWLWILGAIVLLLLIWYDVPSRLFGRKRSPAQVRRERARKAARKAAARVEPPPAEVVIAPLGPGVATKGMRLCVRDCEVTLHPGAGGRITLDKTLAGTTDRDFHRAGREIRRRLEDPAFTKVLIKETSRAAAYLDGNPQLTGAERRRAELRSLVGALEGNADGSPG